jgi:hypothetical protein
MHLASIQQHSNSKPANCPFDINCSWVGCKVVSKKPAIFCCVQITKVNPNHTCKMRAPEHGRVLQRQGHLEANISGMKDIASLMNEKPRIASQVLRPMILKHVLMHAGMTSKCINNFKKRVQFFLLKKLNFEDLTYDQAVSLSSKRMIAADEMTDLDDPFILQNFTAMLWKIMQEDTGAWEALRLMDELVVQSPGFDCRILKDDSGRPVAIMHMTSQMRCHAARRHGNAMYLDAQKRQFNGSGWPHIAPVVKDNEMKVALAAESIVTEETHEFCLWILRSMVEIEPRFELSNIQIIFADQKITPTMLQDRGIEGSCTLRGDFYHLLNEVWPEHFHPSLCPQLRKFLSSMLLSNTVEEWDNSHSCAAELARGTPKSLSALNAICQNHVKHGGCCLRSIESNLRTMNGDVAAEQNHSGVVACLGLGASFSVAEQITHLLNRQKNLDKIRHQKEDDQHVQAARCQSLFFVPQQKIDDSEAKALLSGCGFKELWTRTIKRSFYLHGEITEDGSFKAWPTTVLSSQTREQSSVVIEAEQRCPCEHRTSLQIQCEHEHVHDGQLDIQKFNHRWCHRQTFDRMFPHMITVFPTNQSSRWSDTQQHHVDDSDELQ